MCLPRSIQLLVALSSLPNTNLASSVVHCCFRHFERSFSMEYKKCQHHNSHKIHRDQDIRLQYYRPFLFFVEKVMPCHQTNTTVAAIYPTATAQSRPIAPTSRAMDPTRRLLLVLDELNSRFRYLEKWDWSTVEMCGGRSPMMPWRSIAQRSLGVLKTKATVLGPHRGMLQMLPMCLWISLLGYCRRML